MKLYVISDERLNQLAEAIRSKTGETEALSPAEMVEAINGTVIHTNTELDGMITRTAEVVESNTAGLVAAYAFFNNATVRTVVLPAAKEIQEYAFCDCVNLERISCGASKIRAYAFYGCDALNEILFAEGLTEIDVAAFNGCSELNKIDLRNTSVSAIAPSAFAASGLKELWLPENKFCTLTNVSSFSGCPLGVGGSGGVIYVPLKYRVRYEANTTWAKILGNGTNRVVTY